jgi:hypothetical protein
MTKFQYLSDIHLETRHNASPALFKRILKPAAPYLALCGDIGYPDCPLYEPFLKYCSENFEHVFYVAGNHEFYNNNKAIKYLEIKDHIPNEEDARRLSMQFPRDTPPSRTQKIREICLQYKNIHFLDKEIYHIPDTSITIVGCTLWSKLDMDPDTLFSFNDFYKICETKDKQLTPKTYDDWNGEHVKFLEGALNDIKLNRPDSKIVVLTHHCPTYDIITDKYLKDDPERMNSFFANKDLVSPFGKNVKAWLCGHTHGCKVINLDGTVVATNTLGYDGEAVNGFKTDATIEI